MTGQYITQIQNGANVEIIYDPFGIKNQIVINDNTSSTCIPRGSNSYDALLEYIESNNLIPEVKLSWVQVVTDNHGNTLFFRTDKGDFTDSDENQISKIIKNRIQYGTIEVREVEEHQAFKELEINIFLPRSFKLSDHGPTPIPEYSLNTQDLGLPFRAEIKLIQKIEPDFFLNQELIAQILTNKHGNVIRIYVNKTNIKSIYNWCRNYLDDELNILNESLKTDSALFKRKKSHGPRTDWYFDWLNLQNYVWVLVVHVSNKIIDLINLQAYRKTIGLISRDSLGEMACIKVISEQNGYFLWPLSGLQDFQIAVFPKNLNWQHNMLNMALHRVRFLIDQGLYFESIVVAQSILESIVNGLFPTEVIFEVFDKKEIKWEEKYKYLKRYYKNHLRDDSVFYSYLDGGLKKIYDYRNRFSHDVLVHQPTYLFDVQTFQEIKFLLRPLIDVFENQSFMSDVNSVYQLRDKFLDWLRSVELHQQAP